MKLRTFKVDDADWEQWKLHSNEAGLSLSEWIRRRCNENSDDKAVRRASGVRVARRGAPAPERLPVAKAHSDSTEVVHGQVAGDYVYPIDGRELVESGTKMMKEERIARKSKVCVHGVAKGWRCWQCGGVAIIE